MLKASGSTGITFNNDTYYATILGFNHNIAKESNNKKSVHFIVGKNSSGVDIAFSGGFAMNTTSTNAGGWEGSKMRTVTLASFLDCLPSSLQAVIGTTTKYTDNTGGGSNTASYVTATQDKIFLTTTVELTGDPNTSSINNAEPNYQLQYDYYKNGTSIIRYYHSNGTSKVYWWCRSPLLGYNSHFARVQAQGIYSGDPDGMTASLAGLSGTAFAPCFSLIAN